MRGPGKIPWAAFFRFGSVKGKNSPAAKGEYPTVFP